jgi:hypothetical protein
VCVRYERVRVRVCLLRRRFRIIYKSLSINVAFLFCLNCHTGKHRLRHYSSPYRAHAQPLAVTAAHYRETNNILLITTLNISSCCTYIHVHLYDRVYYFVLKLAYDCPFSQTVVKNVRTFLQPTSVLPFNVFSSIIIYLIL